MKPSLLALLTGLIDYAGVFPPARLTLKEAIGNYARYQDDADSWMLGRFIYAAKRLAEVEIYCLKLFSGDRPLTISAAGSSGATCRDFLDAAGADFEAIESLRLDQADRVQVDVYEVRLPDEFYELTKTDAVDFLIQIDSVLKKKGGKATRLFFEAGIGEEWRGRIKFATAVLTERNKRNPPEDAFGLKLRCGGLEAAAFPSGEQVAFCLRSCLQLNVPFKATAGLHHPLRHFSQELQTPMHGFINLFGAGVLAWKHQMKEQEIERILSEEEPQNFAFTDESFAWQDWRISAQDIAAARSNSLISFGSCSFDEPREDLRQLGWM